MDSQEEKRLVNTSARETSQQKQCCSGTRNPNERLSNTQKPRKIAIALGVYATELTPEAWVVFFFCRMVSLMSKEGMKSC